MLSIVEDGNFNKKLHYVERAYLNKLYAFQKLSQKLHYDNRKFSMKALDKRKLEIKLLLQKI